MKKLQVYGTTDLRPVPSDKQESANFGVIVPASALYKIRALAFSRAMRYRLQQRPFEFYDGPAERLLLGPVLNMVGMQQSNFNRNFYTLAAHLSMAARTFADIRSSKAVQTLADLINSKFQIGNEITTMENYFTKGLSEQEKESMAMTGMKAMSMFYDDVMRNPELRENLSKQAREGNAAPTRSKGIFPGSMGDVASILIEDVAVYGASGKGIPLSPDKVKTSLQYRATAEAGVLSDLLNPTSSVEMQDANLSAVILMAIYHDITSSASSYDSVYPHIDPTPTNNNTVNQMISRVGQVSMTMLHASQAPIWQGAEMALRQLQDTLEFMAPVITPNDERIMNKIKRHEDVIQGYVSECLPSYMKEVTTGTYDYLKRMTGARYLLPEFLANHDFNFARGDADSVQQNRPDMPFSPLKGGVPDELVDGNYSGYSESFLRFDHLDSNDAVNLLHRIELKYSNLAYALRALKRDHDGVANVTPSHATPHVPTMPLVTFTADPPLNTDEFEYVEAGRTYSLPTYTPRWSMVSTGPDSREKKWALSDKLYKPFRPHVTNYNFLLEALTEQHFAWDVEVDITATETSASELATLPVPMAYVDDTYYDGFENDYARFDAQMTTFLKSTFGGRTSFTETVHRMLAAGYVSPTVAADALAGCLFIYEKTSQQRKWRPVTPSLPSIYGVPTQVMLAQNGDDVISWKDSGRTRELTVQGKKFLLVLHALVPRPMELTYVPHQMIGGMVVSIPVAKNWFDLAFETYRKYLDSSDTTIKDMGAPLIEGGDDKNFLDRFLFSTTSSVWKKITNEGSNYFDFFTPHGWTYQRVTFPHIFCTNRYPAMADFGEWLPNLFTHLIFRGPGSGAPDGTIMAYRPESVAVLDAGDAESGHASAGSPELMTNSKLSLSTAMRSRATEHDAEHIGPAVSEVVHSVLPTSEVGGERDAASRDGKDDVASEVGDSVVAAVAPGTLSAPGDLPDSGEHKTPGAKAPGTGEPTGDEAEMLAEPAVEEAVEDAAATSSDAPSSDDKKKKKKKKKSGETDEETAEGADSES